MHGQGCGIHPRSFAIAAKAKVDMQPCSTSEGKLCWQHCHLRMPYARLMHAAVPFQLVACTYAFSELRCHLRLVQAAECCQACCVAAGLWEAAQPIWRSGDATERWLVAPS